MFQFGIIHLLSLLYLTAVVAVVIGSTEEADPERVRPHVLGCWAKLLGGMLGLGLVVYVLGLFAG